MKRLVTVTEIYEHISDEEAEELVATKSNGCDVFEDYCETQYSVRLPEGENLSLYDTCE